MGGLKLPLPVEGEVYVKALYSDGAVSRRVINVSKMTRKRGPMRKIGSPKEEDVWIVTYSTGGQGVRRCRLPAWRAWAKNAQPFSEMQDAQSKGALL